MDLVARPRTRWPRSTLIATVALLVAALPAAGATIGVGDPGDGSPPSDGRCTLREALDNANLPAGGDVTGGDCDPGAAGPDLIQVPAFSVVLTVGGPGDDANLSGDLDVLDSVTIIGAGAAATEIVAGVADRLVDVRPGTSAIDVELIGLSLVGGGPPAGTGGGGLRIGPSANVLLDEAVVRDCTASGGGGGVLNDGVLVVRNSLLIDNRSIGGSDGGGVLNRRTLDVRGSELRANRAEGIGGGIANSSGLSLLQTQLVQNEADVDGGGLATGDDAQIDQTDWISNVASRDGGAIHHAAGTLILSVGAFDQNVAGDGGGGIAALSSWQGEELFFIDNRALREGGAVLHEGGSGLLVGSELRQNNADIDGGGLHNRAVFAAEGVEMRGNTATDRGGAAFNDAGADLRLDRSTLDLNGVSGDGGGLFNLGETRFVTSAVTRNTAGGSAGGLFSDVGSFLTLRNTTVSRNQASQDAGGMLLLGQHQIEFATIARNQSPSTGGLWLGGALEIINSVFADNPGVDCAVAGGLVSVGYNMDSDGTCALGAGPFDLPGTPANLGTLQNNGGPTETHALLAPSAAIDTAEPDCLDLAGVPAQIDQRFSTRPEDGDGNGSAICDRGAFERVAPVALARPVPDGSNGSPLRVGKADPLGIDLELTWDVASCPSPGYHAVFGPLADVANYVVGGGVCGLDPIGSDNWNPSASGSVWFVVIGNDASGTESSWGDSSLGVRNGSNVSGQCGNFLRDNAPTCP